MNFGYVTVNGVNSNVGEELSNVLAVHPGARSLSTWNIVISFLPIGIIAYADESEKYKACHCCVNG